MARPIKNSVCIRDNLLLSEIQQNNQLKEVLLSEIQQNSLFSKINVVSDTHIVNIYHSLSIIYLTFMLAKIERCRNKLNSSGEKKQYTEEVFKIMENL